MAGKPVGLSRFDEAFALLKLTDYDGQQHCQPPAQRLVGTIADTQPNDRRPGAATTHPFRKIFIFGDDHGPVLLSMIPNKLVFALSQSDFEDVFSLMSLRPQPMRQRLGKLGVNDKAHGSSVHQHWIIHLLGGKFQTSTDVIRLQKGIVFQNVRFADIGSQQFQHVLYPKAIMADARPSATLLRIKRDSVCIFHWPNYIPFSRFLK